MITRLRDNYEIRIIAAGLALFFAAIPAAAQESGTTEIESDPYSEAEEIAEFETVVSADRTEMSIFEANRSIESVSTSELQEIQPQNTPEALRGQAGVYLQQTNRGAGSPIIRGLTGPQNIIYVDGIRYSNSTYRTGPNQYLATISPAALQNIEVVRGPSSVLYGSGAMGGVINLFTDNPANLPRDEHGNVAFTYSTADHAPGMVLETGAVRDTFAVYVGGDYASHSELRAGEGMKQPFTDYNTGAWRAKVLFTPEDSALTVTGAYLGNIINDAGRTDNLGNGEVRFTDNTDHLAYLTLRWDVGNILKTIGVNASYHQMTEGTNRHNCPVTGGKYNIDLASCSNSSSTNPDERYRKYEDIVDTFGAEANMELDTMWNRLAIFGGIEFYYDSIMSTLDDGRGSDEGMVFVEQDRGNFSSGSYYTTFGTFLNGDLTALKTRFGDLHITLGGRFSNFAAYAPMVPGFEEDIHYTHAGFTYAGGLQWLVADALSLYGSYNQGFRAPNLQETTVLGNTGSKYEIPNPELEPERSDTFEIGTRVHFTYVDLSFAWYYSLYNNIIDEVLSEWEGQTNIDGVPVTQRVNAAEGVYQGVEASAALHLLPPLTLSTTATWMTGEITSDGVTAYGDTYPGRRIPPVFGTTSIRYDHPVNDRFFAEFYVDWAGEQDELHPLDERDLRICETAYLSGQTYADNGETCPGSDSWYTINLRGGVRFMKNARLVLTLANLTDQKYKPHGSGVYAAGFDGRATLTVGF